MTTLPAPGPDAAGAGVVLDIDLAALARNWQAARDVSGSAEAAAVVKADGYGLGIADVAQAFAAGGCATFFVATEDEGRAVRGVAPEACIYVLNGAVPGREAAFTALNLRPVLNTAEDVARWAAFCSAEGVRHPAAVHLDTGMSRLGLSEAELDRVASSRDMLAAFELALVMSHLACADDPGAALNERQRQRFDAMRARLPDAPASLANSAGMFLGPGYCLDVTRPGISLYGATPFIDRPAPFETVVTARARILQVRDVAPGETIGYGATYTAGTAMRTAIIAAGYADGIHRVLGNKGAAAVGGVRAPYVGRVSMDLIAIDVTAADPAEARAGGWAELFGRTVHVDEVAAAAGTIGYEVLTSVGSRYLRRTSW